MAKLLKFPKVQVPAVRENLQARAWNLVRTALRRGELKRPKQCERCPRPAAGAHHDDYSRPLDVKWLCSRCHYAAHQATYGRRDLELLGQLALAFPGQVVNFPILDPDDDFDFDGDNFGGEAA